MSLFNSISSWFSNHFGYSIVLRPSTSEVLLSRPLFTRILADHPGSSNLSVLFVKTRIDGHLRYAMFFNPDFKSHGVSDPNRIMTVPVTLGQLGHIGFQTIQPSAEEILTRYAIPHDAEPDRLYRIRITRAMMAHEPYYILQP